MNAQKMNWDDIPYVLAVCETGSLSGAARKLGVNHSTVFRRIESVEQKLGVILFERLSHGYAMTTAGEYFFKEAIQLNEGVIRIHRELVGQDARLEGQLVITTTDSLLQLFAPLIAEFQQKYPDVELQILSGTRHLDLMQRDADIAIRPTLKPPEHWVGRVITKVDYAVYTHKDYAEKMKKLSPDQHRWILLIDSLGQTPMNVVASLLKSKESPMTVSSSLLGMVDLVNAGLGIAVLPCYMGDNNSELIRLHESDNKFNVDLWLLAHTDMRRSAKVHAFFEFVAQKIFDGDVF
ncbi:LysR family transcriptional regulator [Pseudoalteromonas sp. MMG013]|uniref:LysR family transcriptional regulator n=1 Tax=Pseudoalteromonas sp. MMG013 TaxID=2822687 RepID=UPI001B370DF5|nr:LysR family transcriptional regulator [Pseudoalteromonas sp. MMG013]MBQ4863249.1 LysR family transcriptional regulator [Pseudoalteromonas sp. MMG013]